MTTEAATTHGLSHVSSNGVKIGCAEAVLVIPEGQPWFVQLRGIIDSSYLKNRSGDHILVMRTTAGREIRGRALLKYRGSFFVTFHAGEEFDKTPLYLVGTTQLHWDQDG